MLLAVTIALIAQGTSVYPDPDENSVIMGGKPIVYTQAHHNLPPSLDRAIDAFSALSMNEEIEVFIGIDNGFSMADAVETKGVRDVLGELIREQNEPALDRLARRIESNGGKLLEFFKLSGVVRAKLSSRAFFAAIDDIDVVDASVENGLTRPEAPYTGVNIRTALRAQVFNDAGFDGDFGNRVDPGLATVVAAIESNDGANPGFAIDRVQDSLGYRDTLNGRNRVFRIYNCGTSPCQQKPFAPSTAPRHSDAVLTTIGGSIEEGQNPFFGGTGTIAQRERSGVSKEVDMMSFEVSGGTELVRALETAWDEGADVANLSLTLSGFDCAPTANPALLNTTISTVTGLGMTVVAAVGGGGFTGNCNIGYPALRPNVLAVGAVDTNVSPTVAYSATNMLASSSAGGIPVTSALGPGFTPGVGLVAPGARTLTPQDITTYTNDVFSGSSIATASVSGLLANLIHSLTATAVFPSTVAHNTYRQRSLLYLMGDRFTGTSGPGGIDNSSVSSVAGYGRLVGRMPNDTSFGTSASIQQGDCLLSAATPECTVIVNSSPTSQTRFKAVAHWNETDLMNVAVVTMTLQDTCNGSAAVADTGGKRLTRRVATNSASGDCLRFVLHADSLPASRRVYWAFLLHSGTFN